MCCLSDHHDSTWTYSVKNKAHSLRSLVFGTLNGLPILCLPADGMFATGRHNDCNTFDYFLLNNVDAVADICPLGIYLTFLHC